MFKRLSTARGSTLTVKIPTRGKYITQITQAVVVNGNNAPVSNFTSQILGDTAEFTLSAQQTSRMHGTYRYYLSADLGSGAVETLQHGILTIM